MNRQPTRNAMRPEDRKGQILLQTLLPWARTEVTKENIKTIKTSPLMLATMAHVRADNFDRLMIYPAPLGGWHADLVFKTVPPGIANCIGSPVAKPYRTRDEAMEGAKRLLVTALMLERETAAAAKPPPPPPPVFLLEGYAIAFMPDMLAGASALSRLIGLRPVPPTYAVVELETMVAKLFPDGISVKALMTLSRDHRIELMTTLHLAALSGILAFPLRLDASPSGHTVDSGTKH